MSFDPHPEYGSLPLSLARLSASSALRLKISSASPFTAARCRNRPELVVTAGVIHLNQAPSDNLSVERGRMGQRGNRLNKFNSLNLLNSFNLLNKLNGINVGLNLLNSFNLLNKLNKLNKLTP